MCLVQSLAASFQLDSPQALSDIEAAATSALGARPIITCAHQRGTAYLDSVRKPGLIAARQQPSCSLFNRFACVKPSGPAACTVKLSALTPCPCTRTVSRRQLVAAKRHSQPACVQVFACVSDSLQPVDCGPSSEECRSRTVTVPSLSSLQSMASSNWTSHARALRSSNAKGCSHSRVQCEP